SMRAIAAERQRGEVEVQLDVVVELLRDARRNVDLRNDRRRLRRQLEPALDLANFFRVLADRSKVAGPEVLLETRQLAEERIQNALVLLHANGALFRCRTAPEQPLENHLWIELHRQGGAEPQSLCMSR